MEKYFFIGPILNYSLKEVEDLTIMAREPLPPMRSGGGGRPVTKSTATLPMGVGVWVHPYHPLKRDSGLSQASLSRQRCLRRDTGTKGVI